MAKKVIYLEELIKVMDKFDCEIEDIEVLEPDVEFIQNIHDNSVLIIDERVNDYVLHSLESVLLLVIFAMIANCNTFSEIYTFGCFHFEWLNKHVRFENGLPSLSTIKRVISFINPKELEELLVNSVQVFNKQNEPIYRLGMFKVIDIKSLDGKTANSSDRDNSKDGQIKKMNAMSAYSLKKGICEATEFIGDKTNEIPTCKTLLERINVKNNLITFDALNTQKETIKYIHHNHGFYVAPVKGNHKIMYEEIKDYFSDEEFLEKVNKEHYKKTIEKRNGYADIREYGFTDDIGWLYEKNEWTGIKSVGYAKRTYRNSKGETTTDTRYYISNLPASLIEIISISIRGEWKIENNLHYYLDMVFKEDENSSFVKNTQKNLNIIRKFCMALLKSYKEKTKLSMNLTRSVISMNFEDQIQKVLTM